VEHDSIEVFRVTDLKQDNIQRTMDVPTYYILLGAKIYLWKDRCASAHAPAANNLDKASACTRLTAQTA
jgi:hypothetical protein